MNATTYIIWREADWDDEIVATMAEPYIWPEAQEAVDTMNGMIANGWEHHLYEIGGVRYFVVLVNGETHVVIVIEGQTADEIADATRESQEAQTAEEMALEQHIARNYGDCGASLYPEDSECEGHYDDDYTLLSGAGIGEATYCNGSCR